MDLTSDVQLIQSCVAAETETTCGTGCQWRHGRDSTTTPTDPSTTPAPLFSQDFCHPVNVDKNTPKTVWEGCITHVTAAGCATTAGCNWSDGKELIPDHDFCAPLDLTANVDHIQTCVEAETAATCNDGCQWRHGRTSTGTPATPSDPSQQPLFSTEFCHPATVSKTTTDTQWASCVASADATHCSINSGCTWSDGKELIPTGDFCAPLDVTNDVQLIQSCVSAEAATECGTGCQWRHGLGTPATTDPATQPG
jgi:hypothetical protein